MSEERMQILSMVAEGKIDDSEAEKLLDTIGQADSKIDGQEWGEEFTGGHYVR